MKRKLQIALIDGPVQKDHSVIRTQHFLDDRLDFASETPAQKHAAAVVSAILSNAPAVEIDNYVIFSSDLSTNNQTTNAALSAALNSDASIIHCSFGMHQSNPEMSSIVKNIISSGKTLVASAPARGGPVFPAGYPGVISVQGDARCKATQWSLLDLPTAMFGACPGTGSNGVGGASIAAAFFSGFVAKYANMTEDFIALMHMEAAFIGREQRCTLDQ